MSEFAFDPRAKRQTAEAWVNKYVAVGVASVMVVSPIPGAATVVLCGIEATMAYQIGKIYRGDKWSIEDGKAVARVIGLAAFAGKIVALEAAILLGPFGLVGKAAIAGAIIKGLGHQIIRHFEVLAEGES